MSDPHHPGDPHNHGLRLDDKRGAGLQGEHGPEQAAGHGAGHEMDIPPTKELFNIVWGLGALTLLSLATCVQLFNNQRDDLMAERAKESGQVLTEYRASMDAVTKGSGKVTFKDSTGAEITQSYVPLAVARELVLSKPDRLLAAPAPKGWMHPDDIAAGAQAGGAAPAGGAVQAPPGSGQAPGTGEAAGAGTAGAAGSAGEGPGPVVPGRDGTLAPQDNPSQPGQPAADPKIDGAGTGAAGTGAAGTADPNAPVDGAGTGPKPDIAAPGVKSPAGVPGAATARPGDAGKAAGNAGQSGGKSAGPAAQPTGPAAQPTPAPAPQPSR